MQTGQMIIESPGALLPQVFKPYSQWAKKIEAVLHGRNVHNFTDKAISELFNPVILARLPSRLLRFVSRDNLQETLDFLKNYDAKRLTWQHVMRKNRELTERPAFSL